MKSALKEKPAVLTKTLQRRILPKPSAPEAMFSRYRLDNFYDEMVSSQGQIEPAMNI